MPSTTEKYRTSGGTPVWITGEGSSVVLVHGVQMDHRMWDAQVAALSDGYRVSYRHVGARRRTGSGWGTHAR